LSISWSKKVTSNSASIATDCFIRVLKTLLQAAQKDFKGEAREVGRAEAYAAVR
jgi:hypothetical protein